MGKNYKAQQMPGGPIRVKRAREITGNLSSALTFQTLHCLVYRNHDRERINW